MDALRAMRSLLRYGEKSHVLLPLADESSTVCPSNDRMVPARKIVREAAIILELGN